MRESRRRGYKRVYRRDDEMSLTPATRWPVTIDSEVFRYPTSDEGCATAADPITCLREASSFALVPEGEPESEMAAVRSLTFRSLKATDRLSTVCTPRIYFCFSPLPKTDSSVLPTVSNLSKLLCTRKSNGRCAPRFHAGKTITIKQDFADKNRRDFTRVHRAGRRDARIAVDAERYRTLWMRFPPSILLLARSPERPSTSTRNDAPALSRSATRFSGDPGKTII